MSDQTEDADAESVSRSASCAQADLLKSGRMLMNRVEEDCAVRGLGPENIDGYSEMKAAISDAEDKA